MNPPLRSVRTSRTPAQEAIRSAVSSGEASSTTITSNGVTGGRRAIEARQRRVQGHFPYTGMITLTTGSALVGTVTGPVSSRGAGATPFGLPSALS